MRVIKVLFLLVFFFVCMLFFVQNTAILETPLILKLGAFGFQTESSAVPFYVVLLLSFVIGGLFATLYFLAEKVRLATGMRSLQNKVNAMEKQLTQKSASSMSVPSYVTSPAPSVTSSATSGGSAEEKAGA